MTDRRTLDRYAARTVDDYLRRLHEGELVALEVGEGHPPVVGVWLGPCHIYGGGGRLYAVHAGTLGLTTVRRSHITGVRRLEADPATARQRAEAAHLDRDARVLEARRLYAQQCPVARP